MKKFSIWTKGALVAGVLAAVIVTTAGSFVGPGANTKNGVVYAYTAGKSIGIRGFGRDLYQYNITSKTLVLPTALSNGLGAGAQVTVVGYCYTKALTSGCTALQIWIRLPAPTGGTSSSATALPPVATPTP